MKINRLIALAMIALLVVTAMAAVTLRSFAQIDPGPAPRVTACPSEAAEDAIEADGANEEAETAGCDAVEDADLNDAGEAEETGGADDEAVDAEEAEVPPVGTPTLPPDEAQRIAEAYLNAGSASGIELEMENGRLVYGVEFSGTDVKVDANTGEIVAVETGQD